MNEMIEFLARHGAVLVFLAVFVEQLGVPLPAAPWLLAAGALAATGKLDFGVAIACATFGSLLADAIWFYSARYAGHRILGLFCRISLEPESCIRKTQNIFTRYGMRAIIIAKFVPGLSTLATPLAGSSGVKAPQFFLYAGAGGALYSACFLFLGVLFNDQVEQIIAALETLGGGALALVVTLLGLFVGSKYYRRRQFLQQLSMARITPDELQQRLVAGENPVILDVRSLLDFEQDPSIILGATRMAVDEVEARHQEIPRDRDVVLYCSCPNEESAAHVASILRRKGITRVRPLLGGIDAWQERGYPMRRQPAAFS